MKKNEIVQDMMDAYNRCRSGLEYDRWLAVYRVMLPYMKDYRAGFKQGRKEGAAALIIAQLDKTHDELKKRLEKHCE